MNIKRILLVLAVVSLITGALILDMDRAVIQYGIRTASRIRWVFIITISSLGLVGSCLLIKRFPRKSPPSLLEQLATADSVYGREASRQLQKMVVYLERFQNLYLDGNIHVFEEVGQSLNTAHRQLFQNAKSILNRLAVEGDEAEIQNKVAQNEKILSEVRVLLNEMVNYLDNKSAMGHSPLESITCSLKMLNDTLGEERS